MSNSLIHVRYHKLFGPGDQTEFVRMRYYFCQRNSGKFCILCAAEKGKLSFWSVIKNKLQSLLGV